MWRRYFFKPDVSRRSKVWKLYLDCGIGAVVARGEVIHAFAGRVGAAVEFRMDAPDIVAQEVGAHPDIVGKIIGNLYWRGTKRRHCTFGTAGTVC